MTSSENQLSRDGFDKMKTQITSNYYFSLIKSLKFHLVSTSGLTVMVADPFSFVGVVPFGFLFSPFVGDLAELV